MKLKDIKSVVTKLANAAALRDIFRNIFQGVGGNLNSLHIYFINVFRKELLFRQSMALLVNSPASTVYPFDKNSRKMMNRYGALAKCY